MQALYWYIKYLLRSVYAQVRLTAKSLLRWRDFWQSYQSYAMILASKKRTEPIAFLPYIWDKTSNTPVDPVYFYQDAWAFEKIYNLQPDWHIDIGSHHKFVSLLSKVVPVTMVDIRPLPTPLNSLKFTAGSILALPYEDNTVPSISSICVLEHIGLGRYGDPLDVDGTEKAITELKRVLAPEGHLFISVPIEEQNKTYFNAHRAFNETYLLQLFEPLQLVEQKYIYGLRFSSEKQSGFGVGCYHFMKKSNIS